MASGKGKLLVGFLEKDNLKLLVYEVRGREAQRVFAGQITFAPDIVKDAFIADPARFSSQVKVAFAQKPQLSEAAEVLLFVHPDKIFTKTIPVSESVETFVRGLPYFKEELVISPNAEERASGKAILKGSASPGGGQGGERVNYLAFEKKLVEDFQRPFLESGKKVVGVQSGLNALSAAYPRDGRYFILAPFDKEIAVAAVTSGGIDEVAIFGKDVFASRFSEFIIGRNLKEVTKAYTFGVFDQHVFEKLRSERGLEIESLGSGDIYDLVTSSFLKKSASGGIGAILSAVDLSGLGGIFGSRRFFLLAAIVVGAILALLIFKNVNRLATFRFGGRQEVKKTQAVKPTPPPPPAPEPKPADFKVRVLNGTLVTGEAGTLGDKLKGMGFDMVETKNATSAGFETTRLRVTSDVPAKITSMLKATLGDIYQTVVVEPLTDSVVKVEIIIGKKK